MKRYFAKPVILGLLLTLIFSSVQAAEYLTVTGDNVSIRTGPGKNHPASMELFQGYPLKVVKKDGDWYQVADFEGDTGFVHKASVKKCDTVIVTADKSINMRTEPSTGAAIVADVERGVVMVKLAEKDKWTQVRHSSGTVGWIYSPLLWP